MRSTEYGCAIMITTRIHISVPDYQNDKILGILKVFVKHFIRLPGVPERGTGRKLFALCVILLVSPLGITQ